LIENKIINTISENEFKMSLSKLADQLIEEESENENKDEKVKRKKLPLT